MIDRGGPFDHYDPAWIDDPYPTYERMREESPVAWSDAHGGFWVLTRYADVKAALHDWTTFTSAVPGRIAIPPTTPSDVPSVPLESDPPEHSAYRRALARAFSQREVDRFEPVVAVHADALMLAATARPSFDVVRDVASPLVGRAIASFLGFPVDDLARIERWADAIFAGRASDPDAARVARQELLAYVAQVLEARSADLGDDVLSRVATLRVNDRPATESERLSYARLLLLAGREATIDALGNAVAYLARNDHLRRRLASEPAAMPAAIEEFLRHEAPIQLLGRVAVKDVTMHGCKVAAGETVAMGFGAAGRDPRAYDRPDEVEVDRFALGDGAATVPRHMAFGSGPHACLGAHLARLCLRVGLTAFLRHLPDYAVVRATRKPNGDARGWVQLVVSSPETSRP